MQTLLISKGGEIEREFPIEKETLVIGRHVESDIHLDSGEVSRKHAELSKVGDNLVIKDLSSSNGTFVNGESITECEIKPGDKVKIGEFTLTLKAEEAQEETAFFEGTKVFKAEKAVVEKKRAEFPLKEILVKVYAKIPLGLSVRFAVLGALLAGVLVFVSSHMLAGSYQKSLLEKELRKGVVFVNFLRDRNVKALSEAKDTELSVEFVSGERGVNYAYLLDRNGDYLIPREKIGRALDTIGKKAVRSHRLSFQKVDKGLYDITTPIRSGSETIGFARIGFSILSIQDELDNVRNKVWIVTLLSIFLGGGAGFLMALSIKRPVKEASFVMDSVARGDLNMRLELKRNDEFKGLAQSLNSMLAALRDRSHPSDVPATKGEREAPVSRKALEAVIELSPFGVVLVDASNNISVINDNAASLLKTDKAIGRHILDAIKEEAFISGILSSIKAALSEPKKVIEEEVKVTRDGEEKRYKLSTRAVTPAGEMAIVITEA